MTLIAAFQCEQGIVLCADSQETVDIPERGSYRVNVNKLEQREAGKYEVIVGGAGDGALVDGFVDPFVEMVSKWQSEYRESKALSAIRRFVRNYHATNVALSPAHPDDKHLGFVVCLRNKNTGNISLWKIIDLHVRSVLDLTLLGWEEPLYWREAKRLYHLNDAIVTTPSSSEAILLGVHLFLIAKETSNVISGNTKILVARRDGIHALNSNEVKELESRVKTFESLSAMIFLALPDVTVSHRELVQYLRDFQKTALELHTHLMAQIAIAATERRRALPGYPDVGFPEDPYLQLPPAEKMLEDMRLDENIIAIRERVGARERQADAEIGWEQFADAEFVQLGHGLHKALNALRQLAQLNRALFESGQWGSVESEYAQAVRQEIATSVYVANEALVKLLGGRKQEQDAKSESGSVVS